jgi:hypothetical protein
MHRKGPLIVNEDKLYHDGKPGYIWTSKGPGYGAVCELRPFGYNGLDMDTAQLLAEGYNSYDKNFGLGAAKAAKDDLLGKAMELVLTCPMPSAPREDWDKWLKERAEFVQKAAELRAGDASLEALPEPEEKGDWVGRKCHECALRWDCHQYEHLDEDACKAYVSRA